MMFPPRLPGRSAFHWGPRAAGAGGAGRVGRNELPDDDPLWAAAPPHPGSARRNPASPHGGEVNIRANQNCPLHAWRGRRPRSCRERGPGVGAQLPFVPSPLGGEVGPARTASAAGWRRSVANSAQISATTSSMCSNTWVAVNRITWKPCDSSQASRRASRTSRYSWSGPSISTTRRADKHTKSTM